MSEYGREYYSGDVQQMIWMINKICRDINVSKNDDLENSEESEDISENNEDDLAETTETTETIKKVTTITTRRLRHLQCEKCYKKFKQKSRYQNHVDTVECNKRYQCPDCGHEFSSQTDLTRHQHHRVTPCVTNETDVDNSLECKCGSSFVNKGNLTRHKKTCAESSDV
jgi:uncharacterized C2H2 Zn-finger protein